jgi:hypothetical protein
MSKKLKAYLIDPKAQTITEVKVGKSLPALYEILKCERITASGKALRGTITDGFDSIFVSDDDIEGLSPEETKHWFQVDADRDPPSSYPICGRGLVHGTDKLGKMCDVTISIAEVRSRITFTQRRFQGFEVTHGFTEMFGKRMPMTSVSPVAPIVDGAAEESAFECIKGDLLEVLRHELGGWDINPKLLRKAFMAAAAELGDDDFGKRQLRVPLSS